MKLNRISGALLACTCFFGATEAWADTVAVMKLDVLGDKVDAQATQVFEAIRTAIMGRRRETRYSESIILIPFLR